VSPPWPQRRQQHRLIWRCHEALQRDGGDHHHECGGAE